MLLPYMEQQTIYDSANFMWNPDQCDGGATQINATAVNTMISVFICPSDFGAGRAAGHMNDYYASMGPDTRDNPTDASGVFSRDKVINLSAIRDGTSNTVAFFESKTGRGGLGNKANSNMVNGVDDGGERLQNAATNPAAIVGLFAKCAARFRAGTNVLDDKGSRWAAGRVGWTVGNTVGTPNDTRLLGGITCRIGCATCSSDTSNIVPASSYHPGGVHVLLCDGSVRFVKDSVQLQTWWAIGTRAGKESVASDEY